MSVKTFLMTWTTDGQFRPPSAYHRHLIGFSGLRGLIHGTNTTRLRSSWNQLLQIVIPTVHASASATGEAPAVVSSSPTVNLLAESRRPNIVITENDILAVLEKETGNDRLRVMFSKE